MGSAATSKPPVTMVLAVALVAAAMLLVELIATRIFSVQFLYHFSFFAVSLVMTGLAVGGILASRWDLGALEEGEFLRRLGGLALAFSVGIVVSLIVLVLDPPPTGFPSLVGVALRATAFLPALIAAGAFLACAFARNDDWIGRLYASDLVAAAAACVATIYLMRLLQGIGVLLAPALLTAFAALALPGRKWIRVAAAVLVALTLAGAFGNVASEGKFLRLATKFQPVFERWNDHSRVSGYLYRDNEIVFVIDMGASTKLRRVLPGALRDPPKIDSKWSRALPYAAYWLGRRQKSVAIIGVGAGEDLGPAVYHRATRIDGYELNGILIDVLQHEYRLFPNFYSLAERPEVRLIHQEGRLGIRHSQTRYDLIQASLIDTWAATASGGFVLAENGLYTVEGWTTFLEALDTNGILTMTRWYLPGAPAETQRLVALAAAALQRSGVEAPAAHVLLAAERSAGGITDPFAPDRAVSRSTILVSKRSFTAAEVERFLELCAERAWTVLWAPGVEALDPVIGRLLDPGTHEETVANSPYDLSAPTDQQPFFFLQIRPRDLPRLLGKQFGIVSEITFNGIRVLMILSGLAFLFAFGVWLFASLTLPGRKSTVAKRSSYRLMIFYFLGIGFGYILIQLGLHMRLSLILGHPTTTLALVLAAMLLGTGIGSAISTRLSTARQFTFAWLGILLVLAVLLLVQPQFGLLEDLPSSLFRATAAGGIAGVAGVALGFAFPLGVRLAAPTGQRAVQKLWAVNGAASIAGSALAALIGMSLGSFFVLVAGTVCYLGMTLVGLAALRRRSAVIGDVF